MVCRSTLPGCLVSPAARFPLQIADLSAFPAYLSLVRRRQEQHAKAWRGALLQQSDCQTS
jgi:hypothetical protein